MLQFDEDYFLPEEREGFLVESMMKRAWAAQMEVLNDIDKVCTKYGISYFADFGTLLGAVRHHGFVPWDDDIDIVMKREDLKRFLQVAEKELPSTYEVLNLDKDENWLQSLTRVVNRGEISFDENELKKFHGCPYILGIDIFILDYLPKDQMEKETLHDIFSLLKAITYCNDEKEINKDMYEGVKEIERLCGVQFDWEKRLKPQLLKLIDRLSQMYCAEESDMITQMLEWARCEEVQFPKEWYEESIRIPFETITVPVPKEYDKVLKLLYGDYHKRVRDTQSHDYPFYKEQKKLVEREIERQVNEKLKEL